MRQFLFRVLLFCGICLFGEAYSQNIEVVYLKNGSIIKCTVLENVLDQYIKIKTSDGSVFVYPMDDVLKIARESGDVAENDIVDIDGNVYRTVKIGEFVWMAENLRSTRYADGTSLHRGTIRSYQPFYYFQDEACRARYGLLYNWAAAIKVDNSEMILNFSGHRQGICPQGWHLPTIDEFSQALKVMKEFPRKKEWNALVGSYQSEQGWPGGTNTTGFSALPAGFHLAKDEIVRIGEGAMFWSVTQTQDDSGLIREARYAKAFYCGPLSTLYQTPVPSMQKSGGASIRCVKDY